MRCGLLGKKLSHSYSPQIHAALGQYTYELFEKTPDELPEFIKNGDFAGLNVTIPYKKTVIPYCDELTETAKALGAVNTIVRKAGGRLVGHNTDYNGFLSMIQKSGLAVAGKKVLVLGSGGASATAVVVLRKLQAQPIVISRSGTNNYQNLDLHRDATVIVNATPVGMYPQVDVSPVDLSTFPYLQGVLDLVYNPARTRLLMDATQRGLVAENGLWMLVAQAKESAQWFTEMPISNDVILPIYRSLRNRMENTILIGMPGCGKSTVGKLLAQKTGKRFLDTDIIIEERTGKTISQIFLESGERGFRHWETQVLQDIGKESGCIIATGGGCVTREENYPLLHQNGRLIWLQRDLSKLPIHGRPISQTTALDQIFQARKSLYEKFADFTVDNNGHISDTVERIQLMENTL